MERYDHEFYEMAPQGEVLWEEDEFPDEDTFTNDCLLTGVDELINKIKLRLQRARERQARPDREADIEARVSLEWDKARKGSYLPYQRAP